ncbi:MAG: helix-turn-helix domain-containing protein [Lachnospiraceae bacterium]|jgi:carbohydrate diacid regulator
MVPTQTLQKTIDAIRDISHLELSVQDADGRAVVETSPVFAEAGSMLGDFVVSPADSQSGGEFHFFKVFDEGKLQYILVIRGMKDNAILVGRMAALQISELVEAYHEKLDRDGFMKNLILDNLLLVDIYEKAKRLHIVNNAPRVVLVVETGSRDESGRDVTALLHEFPELTATDFVTSVETENAVVVRDVTAGTEQLDRFAQDLLTYLGDNGYEKARVAYGTKSMELKNVSKSYKEAQMALEVGRIFFEDRRVIAYARLGIGRLIYQLPIPLCRMFISEVFGDVDIEKELDSELLETINRFFDNNLNVSETSRQLFIHRNTLVYRLDKLQKATGLDLRVFDDAITFKIAIMVMKYMKYKEQE